MVWSVGPKCPFPFDKSVVPSIALLYPACKNNNETKRWLGSGLCNQNVLFHWARGISEISNRNFKMLLNGKRPLSLLINHLT